MPLLCSCSNKHTAPHIAPFRQGAFLLVGLVEATLLDLVIHGSALRVAVVDEPNLIRNGARDFFEFQVAVVLELIAESLLLVAPMVFTQDERIVGEFVAHTPSDHFFGVVLDGARRNADLHFVVGVLLGGVLKPHARKSRNMPIEHQFRWRQICGGLGLLFHKRPQAVDHIEVDFGR